MKPSKPSRGSGDLFRERLDAIIDLAHPLVRLSGLMPWAAFDESFGKFYKPIGRPAKPTRLMVGLHYLKHSYDLSDEQTVERWVENPYWQYFCGFEFFQHELPIDPSLMTRWRKRIGPEAMEELLKATVDLALETKTVKASSLERVTVDTTVQEKAIAHPTDSRLYLKALQALVRQARKAGIPLRQSHTRLAKKAAAKAGRYAHAKQYRRMRRELKRLKIYLGRVYRDVCRKIAGQPELEARFARLLGLVERLLAQQPKDKNKLYSLHAPEVVCIAKGKAAKPYEFGCKVGIAATNREGLFLAAKAFKGNPYDGHTLRATVDQSVAMSGVEPERIYADKGYRGHDYEGEAAVMLSGRKRGLTPTMKRELRRRSAIEPMIGHAKTDGRLGRNYLLGHDGDSVNALLAAAGHNASRGVEEQARLYFDIRIWSAPASLTNYALIGWLLGTGRARTMLLLQVTLNGLNIVLDLVFVLGFGWGVEGVALASLLAEYTAVLLGLVIIARALKVEGGSWRPELIRSPERLIALFRVNRDILIRTLSLLFAFAYFTAQGAKMGDLVLAGNAILLQFFTFMAYGIDGLSDATEVLAGNAKGARNRGQFRTAIGAAALWAAALAGAIALVYWFAGPLLIGLFTNIEEVRQTARSFLFWMALAPLLSVWCFLLDGIFIGTTRTGAMRNAMIVSLAIYLAACWLLVPWLGNHGLWLALMIFMVSRALTLLAYFPALDRSIEAPASTV